MPPNNRSAQRAAALWFPAVALGVATIGSYGCAYYSFGALLPVVAEDTGWSAGLLSGAFSIGALGQGAVAVAAGRALDRRGSGPVLLPAAVAGSLMLVTASFAQSSVQFIAAWAAGAALVGGGLFYNVTMPMVTRLYPDRRAAALSALTLLGALASPLFYPLAGALLESADWRVALRWLVLVMAICLTPAAVLVRAPAAHAAAAGGALQVVRAALADAAVSRAFALFMLASMASAGLLVHQVGALAAAGLSLGTASAFAGARGAFQIPGRLLLTPLVSRFGVRGAMGLCYAFAATAALSLFGAVSGVASWQTAAYFTVVSGMSLGLLSPLHGLFQAEVYGDDRLGTLSGATVIAGSIAAAAGAWFTGAAFEMTGSYRVPLIAVTVMHCLAFCALLWQGTATGASGAVESPEAEPAGG